MNNKKNILFFIPSLSTGGAERVLINLVQKLACFSNLHIIVVTLFKDSGKLPDNVTYAYVFPKKFRGNVYLLKLLPASWLYRMFFDRYGKVDVAISYLQSPTMRIIAGCPDKNTRLINWIHNEFHTDSSLVKLFRSHTEFKSLMMRYNKHIFVAKTAMDAFAAVKKFIPDKNDSMAKTIIKSLTAAPQQIYVPGSFKAIIDLEIDISAASGAYIQRCARCGDYYIRDEDYNFDYCSRVQSVGGTCLEIMKVLWIFQVGIPAI